MDKTTLAGLVVGIGAVLGGAVLDGTPFTSLINVSAFIIVIVGTLGATTLSSPMEEMMRLPGLVRRTLFNQPQDRVELVETFVQLATKARREGLLSLEAETEKITSSFLRRGIQLVVDGTDEALVRQVLEADVAAATARHESGYALFDTMGGFSPTLGIMGAVLGLIHVLSQVNDPTKLAAGIATAFVATLYGVGSANLVFFPFANKLRLLSDEEESVSKLMIHGVLSINAGDNPRIVRQKLESFLPPKRRGTVAGAAASAPAAGAARAEADASAAAARR